MFKQRLAAIYDDETTVDYLSERLVDLVNRYKERVPVLPQRMWDQTDALLISYGDSLLKEGEAPLATFAEFAETYLRDAITFIHLLPFYELNITYFDLLNDPAGGEPLELQIERFLLSQTIPLSFIGIPGIYIHSLLGSRNDTRGVQATGRARSINREQLHVNDLEAELARPESLRASVFNEYKRRLAIRAGEPGFSPNARQEILDLGPEVFALRREPTQGKPVTAVHNVTDQPVEVRLAEGGRDLLSGERVGSTVKLGPYHVRWLVSLLMFFLLPFARAAQNDAQKSPYHFTDETVKLVLPRATRYTLRVLSDAGLSGETHGTVSNGSAQLKPTSEGIYIVKPDTGDEVRFLAMDPPPPLNAAAVRRALPRHAERLLAGDPIRFLAMGDSVTATGDYENMLRMMLARATGNQRIEMIDRSYPGRSVDASVRNFQRDAIDQQPQVAMIMYGLNDQGAGCSLRAYLEQFEWLVGRLRHECAADPIVLLPTPDISLGKDATEYTPYVIRTVGFGTWLREAMVSLDVPVVDTFHALWGKGAATFAESCLAMRPRFPIRYNRPFTTMLETDGKGDGIHPNALGHLAMAKAIYATLSGHATNPPARFRARSVWTEEGLQADVDVEHAGPGRLEIYPVPDDAITVTGPLTYRDRSRLRISWPTVRTGTDLLTYPANQYLYATSPMVVAIDYHAAGSQVYGVKAPVQPTARFVTKRQTVSDGKVEVTLIEDGKPRTQTVHIPENSPVGRMPLVSKYEKDGKTAWAAAEVAYVRYGAANPGEAIVDGDLADWTGHQWFPVGLPVQARWTRGPDDHRKSIDDCFTDWSFKAGKSALHLAVKAKGKVADDVITLYFDPREPKLLGTPGTYYWLSIARDKNGNVRLRPGETSDRRKPDLKGVWHQTEAGATIEVSVPYSLMRGDSWPASGDLGLSIDWRHRGSAETPDTHLQWSEDGHPWNPRWYGVVRLTRKADNLPYMVRIK
jgi:lysophospholipase L1-like esterase